MNLPDASAAPLPELTGHGVPSGENARNDWRQLVSAVPIHAERMRYNTTPTGLPAASRSAIRTGTLRFTDGGLEIEGSAVTNLMAMTRLAGRLPFVLICVYCVYGVGAIVPGARPLRSFGGLLLGVVLPVWGIFSAVMERQRQPVTLTIPWKNFHGAQVDAQGRWISLFFDGLTVRTLARKNSGTVTEETNGSCFLSLNKLDPATIENIVETTRRLAPHSRFARVEVYGRGGVKSL